MKLRIARHTNSLKTLVDFYTNILGLHLLGNFKDHAGYDGVFIGKKEMDWELEFTQSSSKAEHDFDEDDILVFYPDTIEEFVELNEKIKSHQINLIKPKNPYWVENGIMLLDPDGYRVVISGVKI